MVPLSTFSLFCIPAVLLILTPGPDQLYIVARSVGQGRGAGSISALGIWCGMLVHITAATLGLSALLLSSALLFTAVKWAGALYLIYLGARLLLAKRASDEAVASLPQASLRQVFRQGAVTNVLNPKIALFFVAFLPQFVDTRLGHAPLQIATLGLIFNTAGLVWNMVVALMAGGVGAWLRRNRTAALWQERCTGLVFVGLGIHMVRLTRS